MQLQKARFGAGLKARKASKSRKTGKNRQFRHQSLRKLWKIGLFRLTSSIGKPHCKHAGILQKTASLQGFRDSTGFSHSSSCGWLNAAKAHNI